MRLFAVGAGISAGLPAEERGPDADVTLLVAAAYPERQHLRYLVSGSTKAAWPRSG